MIKIVITLVCSFAASSAFAIHLRLTETSITENGRTNVYPAEKIITKGYGLTYIHTSGAGIGFTQLTSKTGSEIGMTLDHSYLDLNYTTGSEWLLTFGAGLGVAGEAKAGDESFSDFIGSSYHLGGGYRYSWFEIYWINRLNYLRYDDGRVRMTSTHYQLGLGVYLP